jgi:hypothetical protein
MLDGLTAYSRENYIGKLEARPYPEQRVEL